MSIFVKRVFYHYENGKLIRMNYKYDTGREIVKNIVQSNTMMTISNINNTGDVTEIIYDTAGNIIKVKNWLRETNIQYEKPESGARMVHLEEISQDSDKKEIRHSYDYSYSTKLWNGKNVKVKHENYTRSTDNLKTQREYYCNDRGELLYEKFTNPKAGTVWEKRTLYKYDQRGNWISKSEFDMTNSELLYFHQRQITYKDGLVTGNNKVETAIVSKLKYPVIPDWYAYKKNKESNQFWVSDPSGNQIARELKFMGSFNTGHRYYFDKTNAAFLELTNYDKAEDNVYKKARMLSENLSSYGFYDQNTGITSIIEGTYKPASENFFLASFGAGYGIFHDAETKQNYYIKTGSEVNAVYPITKLPKSINSAYVFSFVNSEQKKDLLFFENGKNITNQLRALVIDNDVYIKSTVGFYRFKDYNSRPQNSINVPDVIDEKQYNEAIGLLKKDKAESNTAKEVKASSPTKAYVAKCNGNIDCLLRFSEGVFNTTIEKGGSRDEAYTLMSNIYVEAYNENPENAFNMFMKVDGKHMMELLKRLPKEVNTYVRKRASGEVDAYVKKHGKPKIKTVQYKSNGNN